MSAYEYPYSMVWVIFKQFSMKVILMKLSRAAKGLSCTKLSEQQPCNKTEDSSF